jgi:hypothetical protein
MGVTLGCPSNKIISPSAISPSQADDEFGGPTRQHQALRPALLSYLEHTTQQAGCW